MGYSDIVRDNGGEKCCYLWVEADLADVTGDDRPLGFDQRNAKGVVDHGLLHRIHLTENDRGGDREIKEKRQEEICELQFIIFTSLLARQADEPVRHDYVRGRCAMPTKSDGRTNNHCGRGFFGGGKSRQERWKRLICVYCMSVFRERTVINSVDSVLLQLRHLLHPT